MKKILSIAAFALISVAGFAQVTPGRRDDSYQTSGGRDNRVQQQNLVMLETGATAELYLPYFIRELRLTSVNFRSNDYVEVTSSNREYCTIRGKRSTKATQVVCRYKWEEVRKDKKETHEDYYTFNVAVLRVEPEGVNLPQEILVGWGESVYLHPELYPKNAECGFTYRSKDMNVASVSTSGLIQGINLGETEVEVSTTSGHSAFTTIRVVIPACTKVEFSPSSKNFELIGDEMDLIPEIRPQHAAPQLSWESSDTSVLTIDQNGHVRAVGEGKAAIWLRTDNGKQYYKNFKIKKPKK